MQQHAALASIVGLSLGLFAASASAQERPPIAAALEAGLGSANPYAHEMGASWTLSVSAYVRPWLSLGLVGGQFRAPGNDGEHFVATPLMARVAVRYPRFILQPWVGAEAGFASVQVDVGSAGFATNVYDQKGFAMAGVAGLDVVPARWIAVGAMVRLFRDTDEARAQHLALRAEFRF